ncbi:MAG TPA: thioesterase family protein [Gemmatimonadaceae bacterium]
MTRAAFTNGARSGNFARDARLELPSPLMPHSHSTDLRVRYAETDRMGVVYYANYLVWCEVGRVEFMRALGRSYAALEAQGVGLAVSEARVRYQAPARFDELVRIDTTLTTVRSRAVAFDYVITNAESGVRLATAHTALVSIDPAGRLTALPADFRHALELVL